MRLQGVRAALGPGELDVLKEEPGYVGQAVAAVAAETFGQARRALERLDVQWEALDPLLDPDEAVRQESFVSEVKTYERGEFERGVAEADAVVEAEYRTQVVLHNSMETHQAVCHWEDDGSHLHLDAVHLGHPRFDRRAPRPSARQGARRLPRHGRRLRLEEQPRRLHARSRRSSLDERAVPSSAR